MTWQINRQALDVSGLYDQIVNGTKMFSEVQKNFNRVD